MALFFKMNGAELGSDEREVLRYAGYRLQGLDGADALIKNLVADACRRMQDVIMPQAVYEEFDLHIERSCDLGTEAQDTLKLQTAPKSFDEPARISFADLSFDSQDLARNLRNSTKIILLAATIGAQADRLIRRAQQDGSADSAIMQAAGAMYIERFVDILNDKLKSELMQKGWLARPRFSPGFGDVTLDFQREFFRLLPCSKIALSLMDSLIMAPEKSVTAFIGFERAL